MELNYDHLSSFINIWLRKAENTDTGPLEGVFDKFFTLWVAYNRLYEEAAHILINQNHPLYRRFISRRGARVFSPPPDRMAAIDGVEAFCGRANLRSLIENSPMALGGATNIYDALSYGGFYIHTNYETGEPDIEKDQSLVSKARTGCHKSLLSIIYQARCNLFHGQKSFTENQRPLVEGMSAVISILIRCLLDSIELHVQSQEYA
ncbi:hypothetical protein [Pseudoalteromonas sp. GB56]